MYYDIRFHIAEYLLPWEYSRIDRMFHEIAQEYYKINNNLPHSILYRISIEYSNDNRDWIKNNVTTEGWIDILDRYHVPLDLLDCIGRYWKRDDVNHDEKYVELCTRTIDEGNISKIKFLKDCVLPQKRYEYSIKPKEGTMFPYEYLLKHKILSSSIGFKSTDVVMSGKYFYHTDILIYGFVDYAGNNLQSILDKISQYWYHHDYVVSLFKKGYNVPTTNITFKDLVDYGITDRAHELFNKKWIIANCSLDVIKSNGITDADIELEDIIQNRNYPVFKTYYKGDGDPDNLLDLAVEYCNTEAFAVLLKMHDYSTYRFYEINTNVKGIRRLIKLRNR